MTNPPDPSITHVSTPPSSDSLAWARKAGLLGMEAGDRFDHLVARAVEATGATAGYVCLLTGDGPFLRGASDLLGQDANRTVPSLCESICAYPPGQREPLVIEDLAEEAPFSAARSLLDLGFRSYVGIPLKAGEPDPVALFCVVGRAPRAWSPEEKEAIRERARAAETEIELRLERGRREALQVQLQSQTGAFEALVENITDVVTVLGPNGTIRFQSPSVEEVLGYVPENLEGASVFEYVHPEDRDQLKEKLEAALEDETARPTAEFRFWHADGSWRILESRGRGLPSEVELGTFIGVSRDVTERRALQEKVRLMATAVEEAAAGILITGPNVSESGPEIQYVNEALTEMTGYDEEELLGNTPRMLQGPRTDRDTTNRLKRCLSNGEPFAGETINYRKDGTPYHVRWRVTPIRNEAGDVTHFVSVQEDVTDEKRREEELEQRVEERTRQLRKAKEEAEQATRLKSAFLANISHEVRTPLTSIIGFAESIEEELSEENPSLDMLSQFAELIERSGLRLLDTLSAVLNLSMLDAGEMDLDHEPVDAADTLAEVARLHELKAGGRTFEFDVPEEGLRARADPDALQIVFDNLISNAVKFTGKGGAVRVRARSEEGQSVVEIEDTGIGMDPGQVPDLFEAFQQSSTGLDRTHEGPGLGLTVAKRLLNRIGGSIEIETKKGKGTLATVRLPKSE